MNLILLGAPGSGKGTQAVLLSEKYKIPHISTGDIFREAIKKKDVLSNKVKQIVEKGELVPDEIVVEIVFRELKEKSERKGFLLDGFPRTLKQAKFLEEVLNKHSKAIKKVLYIKLGAEEIIKRLSGRRICEQCGQIYHLIFNPPLNTGICDICGGKLYQRKDDEELVIKKRLLFYETHIGKVLSYYEKGGILSIVEANKTIGEVFSDLCKVIER